MLDLLLKISDFYKLLRHLLRVLTIVVVRNVLMTLVIVVSFRVLMVMMVVIVVVMSLWIMMVMYMCWNINNLLLFKLLINLFN